MITDNQIWIKLADIEALQAKDADFTTKLVTKIIDNLQIEIGRIHIRFEDSASIPNVNENQKKKIFFFKWTKFFQLLIK